MITNMTGTGLKTKTSPSLMFRIGDRVQSTFIHDQAGKNPKWS